MRVTKDGFDEAVLEMDLHGNAEVPVSLTIAAKQTSVTVSEKNTAFANSDPVYRQLRDVGLGDTYRYDNFTLTEDVGTFELKSGTITFLTLVNRYVTGAIFIGQGHFKLKPVVGLDAKELARRSGNPEVDEEFERSGVSLQRRALPGFPRSERREGRYAARSRGRLSALERKNAASPGSPTRIHGGDAGRRHDR